MVNLPRQIAVLCTLAVLLLSGCAATGEPVGTYGGSLPTRTPTRSSVASGAGAAASPSETSRGPGPDGTPLATAAAKSASPTPGHSTSRTVAPTPGPAGTGPGGSRLTTGSAGVALTFDDGPDPIGTPRLLALLRQQHVKATFCMIGTRVRAYPALVRQIAADGHTLCNHSWKHLLDLGKRSPDAIRSDLVATMNAIHSAAPGVPVQYFRAPGGNFTVPMVKIAAELGMSSLYWQVDPWDWNTAVYGTGASMINHIIATVEENTRPGSIVLSHDLSRADTTTAYQTLLPWLKARFTLIAMPVGTG